MPMQITMLTPPGLTLLWELHDTPARSSPSRRKACSLRSTVQSRGNWTSKPPMCFPTFRSALPPFLAGNSEPNRSPRTFSRDIMLTEVRRALGGPGRTHQVYEMLDLFFPEQHRRAFSSTPPKLTVPTAVSEAMRAQLEPLPSHGLPHPGGRGGPSKQWPAEGYAETAAALVAQTGGSTITLGTPRERKVPATRWPPPPPPTD